LFFPQSLCKYLVQFERYSLGPEKQTSDSVGYVTQQDIASSYRAQICASHSLEFWSASRQVDEILAAVRHDITAVEKSLEDFC